MQGTRSSLHRKAAAEPAAHQIARIYFIVLGRAPDVEGLKYWADMLSGFDYQASRPDGIIHVIAQLMKSPEGQEKAWADQLATRLSSDHLMNSRIPGLGSCVRSLRNFGYSSRDIYRDLAELLLEPAMVRAMGPQVDQALQSV